MIGNGGHAKQLMAEGCPPDAKLVAIGDNRARKKEAEAHKGFDGRWDTFISAGARLLKANEVGEGTQILHAAMVCANAKVGRHCIVNHSGLVEHDAALGDFVHVAPGAKVLGGCAVGEGVLVGSGAVILPGSVVPPWTIIRACSVWPCDYRPIGRRKVKMQ